MPVYDQKFQEPVPLVKKVLASKFELRFKKRDPLHKVTYQKKYHNVWCNILILHLEKIMIIYISSELLWI